MPLIQFLIGKRVATALPVQEIAARARASGNPELAGARLDYTERHSHGQVRITCQVPIAEFLLDGLVALAETERDGYLLTECCLAIAAVRIAINNASTAGEVIRHGRPEA